MQDVQHQFPPCAWREDERGMTLIEHVAFHTIPAALSLLPERMDSARARALLLAIGLQESKFEHRHQVGGPAHGFWQFEQGGGVRGVLTHAVTSPLIRPICVGLLYPPTPGACYTAIEHHDVLAACFARLLLWTDARVLPTPAQAEKGYHIYLDTWRPGRPHPNTWAACFTEAWQTVGETP